ncbi:MULTISPECIES: DUF190 domain-containing protein [Nitrosomonas]|uniref:DUF190 domain-containing protein n=1 Tax=Nitrosomonas TaxID=914 RepID=UPI0023F6180E|nr:MULTISPECIES: DUF190 domain-containing protein [Nitrosomonas]MCO6435229.1 DUF190 domain-containing protein [Nitrosomonas nitrosa]MCW5599677.1 DUF190 domain-containing protein [Nitrosomonas sp.]MCW5601898.1 DUF190 domain-containing protein [Nitrosomonas sp.]
MHGYQLTFFTHQSRKHDGLPLGEWLLQEARRLGISGATLIAASQGFGHDGKLHSAHFFELSEQPVELTMALSEAAAERMFARLHEEDIHVFYVKIPIEYGVSGES